MDTQTTTSEPVEAKSEFAIWLAVTGRLKPDLQQVTVTEPTA